MDALEQRVADARAALAAADGADTDADADTVTRLAACASALGKALAALGSAQAEAGQFEPARLAMEEGFEYLKTAVMARRADAQELLNEHAIPLHRKLAMVYAELGDPRANNLKQALMQAGYDIIDCVPARVAPRVRQILENQHVAVGWVSAAEFRALLRKVIVPPSADGTEQSICDKHVVLEAIATFATAPQLIVYAAVPEHATKEQVVQAVFAELATPHVAQLAKLSLLPSLFDDHDALPDLDSGKIFFNTDVNKDEDTQAWHAFRARAIAARLA